jgi:hypothetical protein
MCTSKSFDSKFQVPGGLPLPFVRPFPHKSVDENRTESNVHGGQLDLCNPLNLNLSVEALNRVGVKMWT